MVAGRILTGLAALALLAVVVLNVVPPHATTLDDRSRRVSCGTFLFPNNWTHDEACEDVAIPRLMATFVLWIGALPVGAAGLVLLHRHLRDD
jgi:hypothetical protein